MNPTPYPNQPPYWQGPNTMPNYPYQPPPRRSHTATIVLSIVLAVLLCIAGAEGAIVAYSSGVFSSLGAQPPGDGWVTVAHFDSPSQAIGPNFNSHFRTPDFSVSNNWRIQWSCASQDPSHYSEWFIVDLLDENGNHVLGFSPHAVQRACTSATDWLTGTVNVSQEGRFYLEIDAAAKFKTTVQDR